MSTKSNRRHTDVKLFWEVVCVLIALCTETCSIQLTWAIPMSARGVGVAEAGLFSSSLLGISIGSAFSFHGMRFLEMPQKMRRPRHAVCRHCRLAREEEKNSISTSQWCHSGCRWLHTFKPLPGSQDLFILKVRSCEKRKGAGNYNLPCHCSQRLLFASDQTLR